jgi:hypothetical protein
LEFLTYAADCLYTFECRGVQKIENYLFTQKPDKDLGDLYAYELRATSGRRLALGFLFVSGATIDLEFERLIFRMRRTKAAQQAAGADR